MSPGTDEEDRPSDEEPSSEDPEEADLESSLSAYLKSEGKPSEAATTTAIALFDLSSIDDEIAELVDTTAVATRGSAAEAIRFVGGEYEVIAVPSEARLSVTVIPVPDRALVESEEGAIPLVLDTAGGATVDVTGVVRIRVERQDGADIITGPIRVPGTV